jgi:chemotaxis protein MotB
VAKRQHHEEHENHERWLVSYADFITLLFAFFVVMYSVSKVDNKRMADAVRSIKFAMHFKGQGGANQMSVFEGPPSEGGCIVSSGGASEEQKKQEALKIMEAVRRRIESRLRGMIQNRNHDMPAVTVSTEGRRLTIRLSASRFFDPSQAAIRPEMIPALDAIAAELATLKRLIRVEGHTDDTPLGGTKFRDNWELSASRAASVASYINRAHRVDGRLLGAAGYGSARPMAKNDTLAGREINRRIEMVVELNPGDTLDALGF